MIIENKTCNIIDFDDFDNFIKNYWNEDHINYGLHLECNGFDVDIIYYDKEDEEGKCPYSFGNSELILLKLAKERLNIVATKIISDGKKIYFIN